MNRALVVGISEYESEKLRNLDACLNDAVAVRDTLRDINFEIDNDTSLSGYIPYASLRQIIISFFTRKFDPEDIPISQATECFLQEENHTYVLLTSIPIIQLKKDCPFLNF